MTNNPAPGGVEQASGGRGREYWLVLVGSWVLRLLARTWRLRVEDPEKLRAWIEDEASLVVFWHNRLLLVPVVWQRFLVRRRSQGYALTSQSRDGELIAQFLGRFGIGSIRGSATRGGSAALRAMAGRLKRGHTVAITPEGSRGPLDEIKPGMVLLAQLEFSSAWRLRSWDRFFIPKPFSRVTFIIGEPFHVARTAGEEAFERERQRCQAAMMALVRER